MNKPICAITPFSMLDFPDKLACIFWFGGCNMACPYCYNVEFLRECGSISEDTALSFLKSRKNLLEGVVLSGGEASLYKNIADFAFQIRNLGFLIKLDTNGSNPRTLAHLLESELLDFVSLDFKAPRNKEHIFKHSGLFDKFLESLKILQMSGIDFHVRTTLHSDILSDLDVKNMNKILRENGYEGKYFLQHFVGDKETLCALGAHDKSIYKKAPNIAWTN